MDETLLTVAEIAEWLKVNPQTVRNWIGRGELRAMRVGSRRVRVRRQTSMRSWPLARVRSQAPNHSP